MAGARVNLAHNGPCPCCHAALSRARTTRDRKGKGSIDCFFASFTTYSFRVHDSISNPAGHGSMSNSSSGTSCLYLLRNSSQLRVANHKRPPTSDATPVGQRLQSLHHRPHHHPTRISPYRTRTRTSTHPPRVSFHRYESHPLQGTHGDASATHSSVSPCLLVIFLSPFPPSCRRHNTHAPPPRPGFFAPTRPCSDPPAPLHLLSARRFRCPSYLRVPAGSRSTHAHEHTHTPGQHTTQS